MGVASGCSCKEVYSYINFLILLIPTPLVSVTARFATRPASKRATGFETGRPASKPADRITTVSSTPARFVAGQIFRKRVSTRFVAGRAKSSVDNTAGRSFAPWRKTLCYVVLEFFLSAIFHCYIRLAHKSRSQNRREREHTCKKGRGSTHALVQSNDALKRACRLRSRSAVANRAVTYLFFFCSIIPTFCSFKKMFYIHITVYREILDWCKFSYISYDASP